MLHNWDKAPPVIVVHNDPVVHLESHLRGHLLAGLWERKLEELLLQDILCNITCWECVYFRRTDKLTLSVSVEDINMVGRKESSVPMWSSCRMKNEPADPTSPVYQVHLGCIQRAATVDEETIRTKTEMFQIITTSYVEGTLKNISSHNLPLVSSMSCDTKGRVEHCAEKYFELAKKSVSHLKQVETPCNDDHHQRE